MPWSRNSHLLQYSCLEKSMGKRAWQAMVEGVTKSWTWLSDCTNTNVCMPELPSQFIPPSPPPLCPHVGSLCLHLCFCPANSFISYCFPGFHMYALIYILFLSLSDLLHSVWCTRGSSHHCKWLNLTPCVNNFKWRFNKWQEQFSNKVQKTYLIYTECEFSSYHNIS